MVVRRLRLASVVAVCLVSAAAPVAAQTATRCAAGQVPVYVFGFADLKSRLGAAMGNPITCEYADPNGTGDVHQTTSKGLSFWRKSTNTPTFTDGFNHWAIGASGVVMWTGTSIDPPSGTAIPMDLAPLRGYPYPALVPEEGLQPFAGFPVSGVEWPVGDALTGKTGYVVTFGSPALRVGNLALDGDGAWVDGYLGPLIYDFERTPYFGFCPETVNYCPRFDRDSTTQIGEIFRGLDVRGQPAAAAHAGSRWSIAWYDAPANMSYRIMLVGAAAEPYGTILGESNLRGAEALATLAERFLIMR